LVASEETALEFVLNGIPDYREIQQQIIRAEASNDGEAIAHWHYEFCEIDGYRLQSEAAKILIGLGFSQAELNQSVKDFSGGWQMRLNLAQTLISPAELLLLDEPTNHLDLDAIVWFEQWLKQWQGTLILISHDRDFLDNVVTSIGHLYLQKIKVFSGNYSDFETQWAQQLELEQKMLAKHERKRAHLQKFVDRFRYKASKAKQAQSRMKMLNKMEEVAITKVNSPFTFEFETCKECPNPIMTIEEATLGYENKIVIDKLNLQVNAGQRIGLLGPNGAGKSTLVKYLAGQLKSLNGNNQIHPNCKIGYFAQHQLELLDPEKNPFEFFKQIFEKLDDKMIRSYLGGFGFSQEKALTKIAYLSGGEKSRLVLAMLIKQNPNFLLLDEPTNHLDLMMREALAEALQSYSGALILISHDRYLVRAVCDDLWLVADGKVQSFSGDTDEYVIWLTNYIQQRHQPKKIDKPKPKPNLELQKQMNQVEKQLSKLNDQLIVINQELENSDLYIAENQQQLIQLIEDKKNISENLQSIEQQWLDLANQLDEGEE